MASSAIPLPQALPAELQRVIVEKCDRRREYLAEQVANLFANTNPANLWSTIVKYREQSSSDNNKSSAQSYDSLQMSYSGYHRMAYDLLFQLSPEEDAASSEDDRRRRREVYFSHPFFSPATFLAFVKRSTGTVPGVTLYAFTAKRLLLLRLRVELELVASSIPITLTERSARAASRLCPISLSSPFSNGLVQEDIEAFVSDLLPNLRLVRDMPPWLQPYYLCHASRKFMFMCDARSIGSISIESIMKSDVFSELLRIFESDPRDAVVAFPPRCTVEVAASMTQADASPEDTVPALVLAYEGDGCDLNHIYTVQLLEEKRTVKLRRADIFWSSECADFLSADVLMLDNWFSLALMSRIYEHFTALDVDGDGVLTVDELLHYSNDSFTHLAIQRVFECHVQHSCDRHIMDYKTYLNFVIATEHTTTMPSMKYIWKVLDLDETKTYIKISTLRCFCKEIAAELVRSGLMSGISAQSILSEIVDMINPKWHEWISLDDVQHSGQQGAVLPILLSYRNFYAYDCREQTAASATDEYADIPST